MARLPIAVWLPLAWTLLLTLRQGTGALDYHAGLALAPVMGLCAGHLRLADERRPGPWLVLALGPWLLLLGAGLWVPNCARLYGSGFYVLGPLASVLVGAGWAQIAGWLPRWRTAGFYALVLASTVPPLWAFLSGPQVFAYHGLVGFVAGAIYEDAVAIEPAYVLFRVLDLGLWLPVLLLPHPRAWRADARARLLAVISMSAVGVAFARAGPERWRVTSAQIEAEVLPVRVVLPGWVVHLPAGPRWRWAPAVVRDDVAFRAWQLGRFFGRTPAQTVHVYLYPSAAAKRAWMGADKVDLAKPWLAQVHMTVPDYGASVLAHELAHVYAATLTSSPLGLPGRVGLPFDALLVEGVAMAAEWPVTDGLDLHDWAAAMRRLNLAPSLEQLLAPGGFLGQPGPRAYTLAGSFVRWLYERDPEVVGRLYASGDVEQATGRPLAELAQAWAAALDRRPLSDELLARARLRFEPAGLFERPCALAVGRCARDASRLWASGEGAKAAATWRRLLDALPTPQDPDLLAAWASVSVADQGALSTLEQVLARPNVGTEAPGLNRTQRAQLQLMLGDLRLQAGERQTARRHWQAIEPAVLSSAGQRALGLRLLLTADRARPAELDLVRTVLAAGSGPVDPEVRLTQGMADLPTSPAERAAVRYLWGRHQLFRRGPEAAAEALRASLTEAEAKADQQRAETLRLLALHDARRGVCPSDRTQRWWLAEVLERCHWAHARLTVQPQRVP
jgi:hypothetical protein